MQVQLQWYGLVHQWQPAGACRLEQALTCLATPDSYLIRVVQHQICRRQSACQYNDRTAQHRRRFACPLAHASC